MKSRPAAQGRTRSHPVRSRTGFSLVETIVGLTVVAVVSAALVPSVVAEIRKSEVAAIVQRLESIQTGIERFRVDVNRFPTEINQLVLPPGRADAVGGVNGVNGADALVFSNGVAADPETLPPGLASKWAGPYLDQGGFPSGGSLRVPMQGVLVREFGLLCSNGAMYVTVKIAGIAQENAEAVSAKMDGETDVDYNSASAGLVRWRDSGNADPDTLVFLAASRSPPRCVG